MSTSEFTSYQIDVLKGKGWKNGDIGKLVGGESRLHSLKAFIDLAPSKGKSNPMGLILGLSAIGFGLGYGLSHPNHVGATSETLRECGFTEDVSAKGYQEFSQIADVSVVTADPISHSYLENNLNPGEKGYVYPGADNQINFGDDVAGFYKVCQMNTHAASQMFYNGINK